MVKTLKVLSKLDVPTLFQPLNCNGGLHNGAACPRTPTQAYENLMAGHIKKTLESLSNNKIRVKKADCLEKFDTFV